MNNKLKPKTIIILILISFVILFFLSLGIMFFYRLYVMNILKNKVDSKVALDNYQIETILYHDNKKIKTNTYYKNGVGKFVSQDGSYTWVYDGKGYYVSEKDKTIQEIDIENESTALVGYDLIKSLYIGSDFTFWNKIKYCFNLNNIISKDEINGEKTYRLSIDEKDFKRTVWISLKTYAPIKCILELKENNDIYDYEYKIRFNSTKLKDIELSDVNDFKYYDKDNNEIENPLKDTKIEEKDVTIDSIVNANDNLNG